MQIFKSPQSPGFFAAGRILSLLALIDHTGHDSGWLAISTDSAHGLMLSHNWFPTSSLHFPLSLFRCDYGDYVKLYLHLSHGQGVNEKTSWNSLLCGKFPDIEQTHYSSDSVLIFEFRSDWRPGNNTGFRGTFRFLNKRELFCAVKAKESSLN